jgi:hypothetical protein
VVRSVRNLPDVEHYDQETEGTHINHSVTLLEKLGWHQYKDVEADLFKLFDPNGT